MNAAALTTLGYPAILATMDYEFATIREQLNANPKTSPETKAKETDRAE